MGFLLVVVRGRSKAAAHKLGAGTTIAGRQEGCQLQIKSSQVSRRHCELFEKKGLLMVKDLGSSNGTFVNGEKVEGQRVLEPGDELTLGNVVFRIERSDVPGAARKPGDTAVPEHIAVAAEDEPSAEDVIPLDDEATIHVTPSDQPAAATTPAVAAAARKAATATPPPPPEPDAAPELGEDAVADFLLNIELDDEDKV
jgi:pSer/pThr/pTyr-binding forkhead associated (FHA) protein